jgi:NADH dehydrogenase [ubiquinone] 1 alpha subcomplex assembly factor 5
MIQARRTLRPDGVFICALPGGDTLFELRTSLQLASQDRSGGIAPRVSPMTDSHSVSNLVSRAGFALPTIDVDEIKINYPSMLELVEDLNAMGEGNAVWHRPVHLPRDELMAASAIYKGSLFSRHVCGSDLAQNYTATRMDQYRPPSRSFRPSVAFYFYLSL